MLAIHIANLKMPKQDKWWPFRQFKLVARQFGRERFPRRLWDSSRVMHFCHPRLTVHFFQVTRILIFYRRGYFQEKSSVSLFIYSEGLKYEPQVYSPTIVWSFLTYKWWNQDRLIRILCICYVKITIPQIYFVQCQPHSSVLTKCTFITVYPSIHGKHTRLNILVSSRVD